ncbi:hypothetical protein pipiens_007405 [Culex pipiens pipiens]|uniref:Uncharacterized protein n=1 Tax=Culex pipiens pipiens TaxID=38569 RepID=A0ABD1DLS0_CULPP
MEDEDEHRVSKVLPKLISGISSDLRGCVLCDFPKVNLPTSQRGCELGHDRLPAEHHDWPVRGRALPVRHADWPRGGDLAHLSTATQPRTLKL